MRSRYIIRLVGLWAFCLGCINCQPITAPTTTPGRWTLAQPTGGQLAYIGGNGNIYITTGDLDEKLAVTDDATVEAEGNGRSYHRLAWSPDGRLAFAAVERKLGKTRSELFVAVPGQPAQLVGSDPEDFVIYLSWSPQPCSEWFACRRLAYLIEGEQGIDLHLVEFDRQGVTDQVVGAARPFYFTWSADGGQMLWHRSGSRKFHPEASLTLYQVKQARTDDLPHPPGYFLAPAWSPDGESWLDVVELDGGVALRRVDVATRRATWLAKADYDIAFVWSPDGQRIAYAVRGYGDDPFLGPIHVYDITTGKTQRLTDFDLHVQAFFWSPDGQRIGYLNWLALPNESWAQWRVYDLTTGQDRGFNAFNPSLHMRMVIGSFNQYAQSHRFWSPDGRYLTYTDRDRYLVERVWLVDTRAAKGAPPILVDEGSIGVWSWQ